MAVAVGLVALGLALAFDASAKDAVCPTPGAAASFPASASGSGAASSDATFAEAQVLVDADDVRVCARGLQRLSLRDLSAQALKREHPGAWPFLSVEYTVRPLSLVGPYLSIEERRTAENPSPYVRMRVRTYDLRSPGREITLPQLFADPALKQALLADPLLREAAGQGLAAASNGADSATLARRLTDAPAPDAEGRPTTPAGWLGGFWFAGREGERLKVGLALPRREGMREEALDRTVLVLVPPPALSAALREAAPQDGAGLATAAWTVAPDAANEGGSRWARWRYDQRP